MGVWRAGRQGLCLITILVWLGVPTDGQQQYHGPQARNPDAGQVARMQQQANQNSNQGYADGSNARQQQLRQHLQQQQQQQHNQVFQVNGQTYKKVGYATPRVIAAGDASLGGQKQVNHKPSVDSNTAHKASKVKGRRRNSTRTDTAKTNQTRPDSLDFGKGVPANSVKLVDNVASAVQQANALSHIGNNKIANDSQRTIDKVPSIKDIGMNKVPKSLGEHTDGKQDKPFQALPGDLPDKKDNTNVLNSNKVNPANALGNYIKPNVDAGGVPVKLDALGDTSNKNNKDKNTEKDLNDEDDEDEVEDGEDDADDDGDLDDEAVDTPKAGQRSDTAVDNSIIRVPKARSNEIPQNFGHDDTQQVGGGNAIPLKPMFGNVNNNGAAGGVYDNGNAAETKGSLKVVWDWSDFAVNFEQYVMPEQKIRRAPHATTGEPWPMPQYYVVKKDKVFRIDKANFRFKLSKVKCDIIEKAMERYRPFVLEDAVEDMYDNFQNAQSTMFDDPTLKYDTPLYTEAPAISMVTIKIKKPCVKFPSAESDETYDLFVKRTGVHIWANEVWGALRGLETFSQLVFKGTNQMLYIRDVVINDYPRFSHRGVMVDSARHFIFKETIYDVLEGMAQNKMNVMHWHLVDDQSFPFYSQVYPDLSAKGAFHPTFVYMPEDIADIIEFARLRGIRVEPEFDTPGHTYSWGLSRPDLLTQCYQGDKPVDGYLGPMDPSKNETFRFLKTFFKDVLHTFRDQYLHLGGDEVPMTCWQSNPELMEFSAKLSLTSRTSVPARQSNPEVTKFLAKLEGRSDTSARDTDAYYYSYDIRKVLEYYVTRLITDLKSIGSKRANGVRFVFWQEIMNNNVQLPTDSIIHVWQGGMEDVQRAVSLGLNVIYSTCWYLDLIEYGTKWSKYYQCDPADNTYGFSIDEKKVLGGEACLWSEYIDNENYMTTLWPRASAVAERLWSSKDVRDLDAAAERLQEHRCRMLSRGLSAGQISGPDYCLRRGKPRHHINDTLGTNCTQAQCVAAFGDSRVEVEKIKVQFEQKGARMSDCSQAVVNFGSQLTMVLLIVILVVVVVMLRVNKQKMMPMRMCKNKTILMVFVTLILVYFMCYTSIWMQALEFKGSFEKRISSNVQQPKAL